jgi:hypothetical protein
VIPAPAANVWDRTHYAGLSDFQKQTLNASHELTEAVTNPTLAWKGADGAWHGGWWDDKNGNEIGDIAAFDAPVFFDGYAVQREWSNYWKRDIVPAYDSSVWPADPNAWDSSLYSRVTGVTTREDRFALQTTSGTPLDDWLLDDGTWSGWYAVK